MLKNLKKYALFGLLILGPISAALAAEGMWNGLPIVGAPPYCITFVNGNCVQFSPPSPPNLTGNELIPADTNLSQGQNPQTAYLPTSLLIAHGQGSDRNVMLGSDFFNNLWQRGTTFTALTPTTTTMTADRFGVYSSGNTTTVTRQLTGTDISPALGINGSMKIVRPSGTNTSAICVGQVLPAKDSVRFVGNQAIFSFYAQALSGYLSTNNNIIANIAVYTAADSATPGTNTDAFMKGTIAGYTVIDPTSTTVATAPVIPLTTSWVRYSVSGTVPTTVSTNAVTGIGVTICTPVYPASTGVAADGFEIANLQLEASTPPGVVNGVTVTPGNTTPGSFARRLPAEESVELLTYSYVLTDSAITRVYGVCQEKVANTSANCYLNFPTLMRGTPTTTVSATGWSIQQTDATNELCSALAGIASSNTPSTAGLLCTAGGTITLGTMSPFLGGATTSTITFSAEP